MWLNIIYFPCRAWWRRTTSWRSGTTFRSCRRCPSTTTTTKRRPSRWSSSSRPRTPRWEIHRVMQNFSTTDHSIGNDFWPKMHICCSRKNCLLMLLFLFQSFFQGESKSSEPIVVSDIANCHWSKICMIIWIVVLKLQHVINIAQLGRRNIIGGEEACWDQIREYRESLKGFSLVVWIRVEKNCVFLPT